MMSEQIKVWGVFGPRYFSKDEIASTGGSPSTLILDSNVFIEIKDLRDSRAKLLHSFIGKIQAEKWSLLLTLAAFESSKSFDCAEFSLKKFTTNLNLFYEKIELPTNLAVRLHAQIPTEFLHAKMHNSQILMDTAILCKAYEILDARQKKCCKTTHELTLAVETLINWTREVFNCGVGLMLHEIMRLFVGISDADGLLKYGKSFNKLEFTNRVDSALNAAFDFWFLKTTLSESYKSKTEVYLLSMDENLGKALERIKPGEYFENTKNNVVGIEFGFDPTGFSKFSQKKILHLLSLDETATGNLDILMSDVSSRAEQELLKFRCDAKFQQAR